METRILPMPKALGTQFEASDGDLTLLWNDFESTDELPKGLVIMLDEDQRRIVIMPQTTLLAKYRQIPDYNLELEFTEEQ